MCEYCEQDKTIMVTETICRSGWGWGYDDMIKLTLREAEQDPMRLGVFIDRGYIRMVDLDDCNCMDTGEKFKIRFCPNCGTELKAI